MERLNWSERNAVICGAKFVEMWECGRCLNNRGTILVYVHNGRRYRCDKWVKTTAEELAADGFSKTSRRDN